MNRALMALIALAAAAGPVVADSVRAQGIDMTKGGPVEVTSDNGMEWRQNEQVIIASGNARAVRGTVTVTADRLIAHYRKKALPPGSPAVATQISTPGVIPGAAAPNAVPGATDTGSNEIYRLEAQGNVRIFTASDQASGDRAIYDIDQAVLVMTGHDLHIDTPQQVMKARDTMEYWSQKHMMVGRGSASVETSDGRRLSGDTLVGYTVDPNAPAARPAAAPAVAPSNAKPNAKPGDDPASSGKLQRVDAFGHVVVLTATEIIHADKAVYVPDSGIARLAGNVHLTRGENQLNGDLAVVNLRTGVSTLTRNPGSRVEGLVMPRDAKTDAKATDPKTTGSKPAGKDAP